MEDEDEVEVEDGIVVEVCVWVGGEGGGVVVW